MFAACLAAAGALACVRATGGPAEPEPVVIRPRAPEPEPAPARPPAGEPPPPAPADTAAPAALPLPPSLQNSPLVTVALVVSEASARIGGRGRLLVSGPRDVFLGAVGDGEEWTARARGGTVVLERGTRRYGPAQELALRAPEGSRVEVNGRAYRGSLRVVAAGAGVRVINAVTLDEYLPGVVGAEMGSRPAGDREALAAQAVVSRTYALRNRGRWRREGYDFRPGVSDQVYGGITFENPLAVEAVERTAGLVLTAGGEPIDAFFFSTCGGHTERGTEVFSGADRPYLQGVPDVAPGGQAWCSISPRFAWRETWTGPALRETLRRYLPDAGVPASRVRRVVDLSVGARTGSRRVRTLAVRLGDGTVDVPSNRVRSVLRPASGALLMSTLITLRVQQAAGEVSHLEVEGSGNGHGVGMCQWGAIGRARAGHRHEEILQAYYPGTRLERIY